MICVQYKESEGGGGAGGQLEKNGVNVGEWWLCEACELQDCFLCTLFSLQSPTVLSAAGAQMGLYQPPSGSDTSCCFVSASLMHFHSYVYVHILT